MEAVEERCFTLKWNNEEAEMKFRSLQNNFTSVGYGG
jgi:hypothetical protein